MAWTPLGCFAESRHRTKDALGAKFQVSVNASAIQSSLSA